MRTFIGLGFDGKLKERLIKIQNILKANTTKGIWVNPSNFHITFKFLGEIDEAQIDAIGEVLSGIASNYSPIALSLDQVGYFNRRDYEYGVIWLGLEGEVMKLNEIYDIIEENMQTFGFNKEKRKFIPHITIGRRIRTNKAFDEIKEIIDEKLRFDFLLDNLILIKSEEIMKKRVYIPIKPYKLGNNYEGNHR